MNYSSVFSDTDDHLISQTLKCSTGFIHSLFGITSLLRVLMCTYMPLSMSYRQSHKRRNEKKKISSIFRIFIHDLPNNIIQIIKITKLEIKSY